MLRALVKLNLTHALVSTLVDDVQGLRDAGEEGRRERAGAQARQDRRRLLSVIRGRLHRRGREAEPRRAASDDYIEIDPGELANVFSVPGWLRDVGLMSWLLVGVALLSPGRSRSPR